MCLCVGIADDEKRCEVRGGGGGDYFWIIECDNMRATAVVVYMVRVILT